MEGFLLESLTKRPLFREVDIGRVGSMQWEIVRGQALHRTLEIFF